MKPRVLMLIHQFHPFGSGAERQAERLARKLIGLGFPVRVLSNHMAAQTPLEESYRGLSIIRLPGSLSYSMNNGDYLPQFRYLIRHRHTYDILHSHMAFGHAVVAALVSRYLGKRSVLKVASSGVSSDVRTFQGFSRGPRAMHLLRSHDAVVAVSRQIEQELLAWGFRPQNVHLIPNGVDMQEYAPAGPPPPDGPVRFIFLGNLYPIKGPDVALRAAAILLRRRLPRRFSLDFYGWDYPAHDYRALARELGVAEQITFHPFQDGILDVLRASHCLILPSRSEGLSNVLLEAMACQVPVIASLVSGTRLVLDEGTCGTLVRPGDPQALAEAMEEFILHPQHFLDLALRARDRVARHFALDSVAQRYADLYLSLYNRGIRAGGWEDSQVSGRLPT